MECASLKVSESRVLRLFYRLKHDFFELVNVIPNTVFYCQVISEVFRMTRGVTTIFWKVQLSNHSGTNHQAIRPISITYT